MRTTTLGVLALALAGCASGQLGDRQHPTGSSSLAASSDYKRVFVTSPDAGAVAVVDVRSGDRLSSTPVGLDPVRLARVDDRIYVTVRGSGEVASFSTTGDTLTEVSRIDVGPDPFGLVASEDGTRLFAAVGMANQVVEIDTASDRIVARYAVPDQPRWLALHPSGRTLYVGSAMQGTWSSIDLVDAEVTTYTPPTRTRTTFDDSDEGVTEITLTPRITGDLAVSPYGDWVAIPVFYVDNITPVGTADGPTPNGGYASGPGVGRTNPSVLLVETDNEGETRLERQRTVFAQGFMAPEGDGEFDDEFDEMNVLGGNVRSYISSVTSAPDGLSVLATMEGSQAIIGIPVEEPRQRNRREDRFMSDVDGLDMNGGFDFVDTVTIQSGAGPRGVTFVDSGEAVVDTWLERSASQVDFAEARDLLRRNLLEGEFIQDRALSVTRSVQTGPAVLAPEVEAGRQLFFSATDSAMAAHSGGISCATCHYDGRNDGLTWTFDIGARQTPSLAGVVSETTPVTWTNDVPTVATEVRLTSRDRMGGSGASVSQSYDVEAYIDTTPFPKANLAVDAAALERGRDLFFGEAGCAECHSGAAYTDRVAYDMFGLEQVMTPTLRGIAATPPYGHDGRAATLRDLVENAENWNMGKTNHLSDAQKDELALFVSTL